MSAYLVVPLLALVAVLQTSIVPHLAIWGVFPDLPLLVVVSWGLLAGVRQGLAWGFVAGLGVDVLSGSPFGAALLGLMAAGALSGLGEATLSRANIVLPSATALLTTMLYDLVFLLARQLEGAPVAWLAGVARIVLPSAVLNAVLVLPVLWAMRKVSSWLRREEMEL